MEEYSVLSQQWIQEALMEFYGKEELTRQDLEKIQYMKIGESFDNTFVIEVSVEEPPVPFYDPMGGDEWECCVLDHEQIQQYVDENMADGYKKIGGGELVELCTTPFSYPHKDMELEGETYEAAEAFAKTIFKRDYYEKIGEGEKIEDSAAWENWYENTRRSVLSDCKAFPNLKVLRLTGGYYKDFSFLTDLKKLEVLELVETVFEGTEKFEELKKLKQLCSWMD